MYKLSQIFQFISTIRSTVLTIDATISMLAYDSRKIRNASESLFFALTHHRDGHQYIADAYAQGVRHFVVSQESLDIERYPDAHFIWVADTLQALQQLAAAHRAQFSYPVFGITGSNGKTIVKEWLFQLLSQDKKCFQSPKSFNSQLGVALSLWQLSEEVELALIEAGISEVGEMSKLQAMIQPTWGICTSLGTAHREGFESKAQKLAEKWQLFASAKKIIAPSTYLTEEYLADSRLVSWGTGLADDLVVLGQKSNSSTTSVTLRYQGREEQVQIPFVDRASIENVLTCILTVLEMGYSFEWIKSQLSALKPLEMRLKLKKGRNQCTIIDDTYSNDLASLQIALDFLGQQQQHPYKRIILSDFEGESYTSKFENKLIQLLHNQQLDELILVGDKLGFLAEGLSYPVAFYPNTTALIEAIQQKSWRDTTVLIKGARRFHLEDVSQLLVEKSHDTVLEINLKSIEHNLKEYRSKLSPQTKLMAMVKAFSYGSGSFEVANVLQFNKVDYLTVAFVDEGVELRGAGVQLPIMVLSPHEGTFDDLVSYKLEPEIYSIRILRSFSAFLAYKEITDYPIHIKLDTGMHRLGFMANEVDDMLEFIKQANTVKVASTFSHLVGAGDPNLLDFTQQQIELFKTLAGKLEQSLGYTMIKHICNTSGILHHPEAHLDMVRLGIGLYGYDMAPKGINLEEVGTLKTTISQIKHLPMTETVGYDRKGVLYRDSKTATVKIGYADGYNRRLGNGIGKMLINGQLVPTIGNICMDMCMLDITDIEAKEGDEVLVFPDVSQISKDIGTIPYELLTGISSRVKRVYFYE